MSLITGLMNCHRASRDVTEEFDLLYPAVSTETEETPPPVWPIGLDSRPTLAGEGEGTLLRFDPRELRPEWHLDNRQVLTLNPTQGRVAATRLTTFDVDLKRLGVSECKGLQFPPASISDSRINADGLSVTMAVDMKLPVGSVSPLTIRVALTFSLETMKLQSEANDFFLIQTARSRELARVYQGEVPTKEPSHQTVDFGLFGSTCPPSNGMTFPPQRAATAT